MVKNLPAMWETWVQSLGWEDALEGMATHSSVLAWRIRMNRGAWQATVHGVTMSQTRLSDWTELSLSLLQGIFPTQGLNPGLPHCRRILYQMSHKGSLHFGILTLFTEVKHIHMPVIPLLDLYPTETHTDISKDTHISTCSSCIYNSQSWKQST